VPQSQSYVPQNAVKLKQTLKQQLSVPVEPGAEPIATTKGATPRYLRAVPRSNVARPKKGQERLESMAALAEARAPFSSEVTKTIDRTESRGPSSTPPSDPRHLKPIAQNLVTRSTNAAEAPTRAKPNPTLLGTGTRINLFFSHLGFSGAKVAPIEVSPATVRTHRLRGKPSRFAKTTLWLAGGLAGAAAVAIVFAFVHPSSSNSPDVTRTYVLSSNASTHQAQSFGSIGDRRATVAQPSISDNGGLSTQASAVSGSPERARAEPKIDTANKTPRNQRDRSGKSQTKLEARALVSPVAAKRPAVEAKTRAVTVNNKVRASVKAAFKCADASITVTVSPLGHVSSLLIPQQRCQVKCTGMGNPVCPSLLTADAASFEIR
jgi:hypothetical protein